MQDLPRARPNQWRDFINLLLGIWVYVSPWVLGYSAIRIAELNANAVGLVIAVAAIAAIVHFYRWEEWVNILLGAWLIASPWVLPIPADQALMWNQGIAGAIVCGLAVWSAIVGFKPEDMGPDETATEH